ncbi:EAL-associated domain-containing protein [Bacillus solitudinis]|nr:EAL-associated domain-containing protein [Bacillus solitudinis]
MEATQRGYLSDGYFDIETNELIQTFSFPFKKTYLLI